MLFKCKMKHPQWSATDITVWRIDDTTALISDNTQTVVRGGVHRPVKYPQRWWVSTVYLMDMPV